MCMRTVSEKLVEVVVTAYLLEKFPVVLTSKSHPNELQKMSSFM